MIFGSNRVAEEIKVKVFSDFNFSQDQIEKGVKIILRKLDNLKPGNKIEAEPFKVEIIEINPPHATKINENTKIIILNGNENEIEDLDITFDDIVGYDEYKKIIQLQLQKLKKKEHPNSILIYGEPGVGKTTLLYATISQAKKLGINVFEINGSIFDKEGLFGVSARSVREIFEKAKNNQPSLIIIDELEQFGLKRDEKRDDEGIRILDEILKGIDEIEHKNLAIMVIAITNTPKLLDKALIRRGRFTYYFKMNGLPNSALLNLLKKHLKKEGIKLSSELNPEMLNDHLSKLTPADIVALAKRLKDKTLIYNIDKISPDLILSEINKMIEENRDLEASYI